MQADFLSRAEPGVMQNKDSAEVAVIKLPPRDMKEQQHAYKDIQALKQ